MMHATVRSLIHRLNRLLEAPVPDSVKYNSEQQEFHKTPQAAEAFFLEQTGNRTQLQYPRDFQEALQKLSDWISNDNEDKKCKQICSSSEFVVIETHTSIGLAFLFIRPCMEDQPILNLILYLICQHCIQKTKQLEIHVPFPSQIEALKQISTEFKKDLIWSLDIKDLSSANFNVEDQINVTTAKETGSNLPYRFIVRIPTATWTLKWK